MSAARYVGRVGGLAVALGVGAAIFTGQGVASADSDSAGAQSKSGATSDTSDRGEASSAVGPRNTKAADDKPGVTGGGRHRGAADTPASSTATSIAKRLSDAREHRLATAADRDVNDAARDDDKPLSRRGSSAKSLLDSSRAMARAAKATAAALSEGSAARNEAPADEVSPKEVSAKEAAVTEAAAKEVSVKEVSVTETATNARSGKEVATSAEPAKEVVTDQVATGAVAAKEVVADQVATGAESPNAVVPDQEAAGVVPEHALSAAKEWLASPRVAAGRAAEPVARNIEAPPSAQLATPATAETFIAPAPTQLRISSVVTDVLGLSPFAGSLPSPFVPADSPAELLLLAGARRELPTAAIASAGVPDVHVYEGVISGCVVTGCPTSSGGLPLTYTVIGLPSNGGKVTVDPTAGGFTFLPFAPETSTTGPSGTETFRVLVAETTPFGTLVTSLPVVGETVFAPVIVTLQQTPGVNVVLAPLIGSATVQLVVADIDSLRAGQPIAFTTMMTSFDGTKISVNYFPALNLGPNDTAPTILNGPGLATAGNTDPSSVYIVDGLVPGLKPLRAAGYNVVTWDPRGEFASGGTLQLDSPAFEGKDVMKIIDWVGTQPGTEFDSPTGNDPKIGMVGGSYGGGIQLVTAGIDPRVDAIVPGIAWNTLNGSLYPRDAFKTAYSSLLLLGLVTSGATINPQIYSGIITGAVLGVLTDSQQALLASSGPDFLLNTDYTTPTLFLQGTVDVLFPLQQAINNALLIPNAPVKMIFFCGGHGACLDPAVNQAAQSQFLLSQTLGWLDTYVRNGAVDPTDAKFEWIDQMGNVYSTMEMPTDGAFYGDTVDTPLTPGGLLPIVPIFGGSGPQTLIPLPYSLGLASEATNAIDIPITAPVGAGATYVVGAPELTMTYSGIGTSRHVYAQIVDDDTGRVVGNIVTPIPVTLDGSEHTVVVPMEAIVYTMNEGSNLKVQIVTAATPYLNITQFGVINVSEVGLKLPTVGAVVTPGTLPTPSTAALADPRLVAV